MLGASRATVLDWSTPQPRNNAQRQAARSSERVSIRDSIKLFEPFGAQTRVPPGEDIATEGDPATHAWLIEDGVVELLATTPAGDRMVPDFLLPGDPVGLSENDRYLWTARAVNYVHLRRYPIAQPDQNSGSAAGNALIRHGWDIATGAWRFQLALARQTPKQRIASFLIRLSKRSRVPLGGAIQFPMTHNDIGLHLGIPGVEVTRCLSELTRDAVIAFPEPKRCAIVDAGAIVGMALRGALKPK